MKYICLSLYRRVHILYLINIRDEDHLGTTTYNPSNTNGMLARVTVSWSQAQSRPVQSRPMLWRLCLIHVDISIPQLIMSAIILINVDGWFAGWLHRSDINGWAYSILDMHTHTHIYTYTHTYTHTYTYTHTHIYTNTYTHTNTHTGA